MERRSLESLITSQEEHAKLLRMFTAMAMYDVTDDPVMKEILIEEIRELKKSLVSALQPFKSVECLVAGDKGVENVEMVVCAEAGGDAFTVKGTIEVPCSKCGIMVLLSPDSPKAPPKVCFKCAVERGEQINAEENQDSLGA